ncbi:helix-turn-helix transcriptional regulator [Pseudomonas typographi]|uniref:helix-turn-helix transcriptional regulator n=1 Tax=Pseudomonas typographi TaxID=2715964 RepID=UPI001684D654|nr:LuxR C-terminal-related transcriptional regulator [Pseudomonas typographi]MBD1551413.1 hypothetical protein [Pseudomonas typographi]
MSASKQASSASSSQPSDEPAAFPELDAFCNDIGFSYWSLYLNHYNPPGNAVFRSNLPAPWQAWTQAHLAAIFDSLRAPRFEVNAPFRWGRTLLEQASPMPRGLNVPAGFEGVSIILQDAGRHHRVFTVMRDNSPLDDPEFAAMGGQLAWMAGLLHRAARLGPVGGTPKPKLTPRQVEVMRLVVVGKTAQEISNLLNVSRRTVRFHQERVMITLDTTNITAAAFQAGLLGLL